MVYFGPSGACLTCKRRRKKCDETRPSCIRCLTANRTCGGYEDASNFRQYEGQVKTPIPFQSTARKCSLPVRISVPGSDTEPPDCGPKELSDEQVEQYALRAFFYDYCLTSAKHPASRGFLDDLEPRVHQIGWQSDLAKACKAVGFASHGIKLNRPYLIRKAEDLYHDLLGSLAKTIQDPELSSQSEAPIVATLLGLYEMTMASESNPGFQNIHVSGLAAILQLPPSAFNLEENTERLGTESPLVLPDTSKLPMVFSPFQTSQMRTVDELLLMIGSMWNALDSLSSASLATPAKLCALKMEAMILERDIHQWQQSQKADLMPSTAGHINHGHLEAQCKVGYWPGRVDNYIDLYTATRWNISRVARCLLIEMTLKLSQLLHENQSYDSEQAEAYRLIEDTVASIPYHLIDNLQAFLRDGHLSGMISDPGKKVGGLLLMHSICVLSRLEITPPMTRQYLTRCLSWIGIEMGIGQASLLANAASINKQYFADGCTIIWAAFLR